MTLVSIPESHRHLFDGHAYIALTTVMPDGQPQTTPVWCNYDGEHVFINTMQGFRKEKNLRQNAQVTLLAYDPKNPNCCVEVRGRVIAMTEVGATEHLDELTQLYMHKSGVKFFGDSVPAELEATYHPVKVTIEPRRVRVEG